MKPMSSGWPQPTTTWPWIRRSSMRNRGCPARTVSPTPASTSSTTPGTAIITAFIGTAREQISVEFTSDTVGLARYLDIIEIGEKIQLQLEGPDGLGGFTRYYELPEIIRLAAPIYLKFGLRNAPFGMKLLKRALPNGREHRYVFIPSKVQNNRILMANDPEYINRLYLVGSAELVRAWLEGDWNAIEGAFFDSWSMERHVVRPFKIPDDWVPIKSLSETHWSSSRALLN